MEHAYRKAPHYEEVVILARNVLFSGATHIHQFAKHSNVIVAQYLDLKTEFLNSSSNYNNNHLKGQERILDICLKEQANHYINPIGGVEIYSPQIFEQKGLKFNFLKTSAIEYSQNNNEFIPNLSIIDVLMFNEKDKIKSILQRFELV